MRLAADDWKSPFQTLVAIIMSARTKDETTIKVAEKLFARYPDARSLARAKNNSVAKLIRPVNFFRNKTRSIRMCAKELVEDFEGEPPFDVDRLVLLPGVGRKTANVFLAQYGTNAIGVDTHVAFISKSLGWTAHVKPNKIEDDLMKLFSRNLWKKVNMVCVRFGKTHISRKKKESLLEHIRSIRS
jgi:endonuclease-3